MASTGREQAKSELEKVCGSTFASLPAGVIDALLDWKLEGKVPEAEKSAEPAASKEQADPPKEEAAASAAAPATTEASATAQGDATLLKVYLDAKDAVLKMEAACIEELEAFVTPPPGIIPTFAATCEVCGKPGEWDSIKKTLLPEGGKALKEAVEKVEPTAGMADILKDYCAKHDAKDVARVSWAASVYSLWIHALYKYCLSLSAPSESEGAAATSPSPSKETAALPENEDDAPQGAFELTIKTSKGETLKIVENASLSMTRGHLIPKLERATPTHVWSLSSAKGPLKGPTTLEGAGLSGDKGEIIAEKVETKLFKPYFAARDQILKGNGKDIDEVACMKTVPKGIAETLRLACAVVGAPKEEYDDWEVCRTKYFYHKGEGFKNMLKKWPADKAPHETVALLKEYIENPEYDSKKLALTSLVASTFCPWLRSLYKYSESIC